ncbi:hypothetical protein DES53_103172 [Roseimicrobium gellanilyticum]|uniref:Uncharacterized protein n=1 Tax=Roseimicrobium gellanilyticum TaxID=748857 RepID=A0A366HNV3_9BACT|nr:hypothetical protein [Roseimicrobium gellanilyticum]RBP45175.1 hypothetical protein DES53_103172 [Roseimicrobium gellanilyticum]
MKSVLPAFAALVLLFHPLSAAEPAAKPATLPAPEVKTVLKITPGKVIIPFDRMQRPWGELISLDFATRTGKFRRESNDEVVSFTVMPYAELLHHATNGDLQDFRVGERAIFRLHENEKGEWVWLTYIQDEMNMMNGHKEYFYVDTIDAAKKQVTCTWANFDKSFIREKGVVITTDADTRYWKAGLPAAFTDIKVGEKLRTKTHGVGKGKVRVAWEVFLDDESLAKFQSEQKAVHADRMKKEGAPGYVDEVNGATLKLTLFNEGSDVAKQLKVGKTVKVAPAGVDRKPSGEAVEGRVTELKANGRQQAVTLQTAAGKVPGGFQSKGLFRLWLNE